MAGLHSLVASHRYPPGLHREHAPGLYRVDSNDRFLPGEYQPGVHSPGYSYLPGV
jgi:hypothetical protein